MSRMSRVRIALLSAMIATLAFTFAPGAVARDVAVSHHDAWVYIVHGVPGGDIEANDAAPFDLLLDNETCLLRGMTFGEVHGPVGLDAGDHRFKIMVADSDAPCEGDVVVSGEFVFAAGEDASVVVHLDEEGGVTETKFVNDFSRVDPSSARMIVHHTAALGLVDITLRRGAPDSPGLVFLGSQNAEQDASEIRWGLWDLWLGPPSGETIIMGPETLLARPFSAQLVYVVGSLENDTLTLITKGVYLRFKSDLMPWLNLDERRQFTPQATRQRTH